MTGGSDSAPGRNDHPNLGLIAAYADGRLTGAEAARVEEHLAGCSECYEVFAETISFALAEEVDEEPVSPKPAPVVPFVRRRVFQAVAGLAAAAGLFLVVHQLWRARSTPASPSLVAELAQAMGSTRFVEPRLTGGFQHGRFVVLRGGDAPQGLDAQSPAVLAAVAHIRERSAGDTSPEALGALAVTYLVSGDVAGAVKALESATAQDPKNAKLQSDLAAAYLVRASRLDEPSDIPKALEAAEKSVEVKDAPVEAWFNRALALESLHLVDAARKAWDDYLQRDPTSPWAEEAKKRREELPPAQQSTLENDRARAKTALAEGKASVDRLADEAPSILRDYFDNVLLYAWADAYLAGKPEAAALKAHAELAGAALRRTTGDAMPHDAALALSAPPSGPSRDPPRTQALAYKALQSALALYDRLQRSASCTPLRQAQRILQSGHSPYAMSARERAGIACFYPKQSVPGLAELKRIEPVAEQHGYLLVLGRVRHMQGLFASSNGDFATALDHYQLARDGFRTIRDSESEAKIVGLIADGHRSAGNSRQAWREQLTSLSLINTVRDLTRRHTILAASAFACHEQRLPRAALWMVDAALETALREPEPVAIADALTWRSLTRHELGFDDGAAEDLTEARRWIGQESDSTIAQVQDAFVDAAEGEILARRQPERAASSLEHALPYFERSAPAFVPNLRLHLSRAQLERGLDDAAEAELTAGIRMVESQRASQRRGTLQAQFFDTAAPLFDDMVGLQLDKRHDPQRALAFVERGRTRQLLDSLRSSQRTSRTSPAAHASRPPLGPEALQRELPDGSALVYYVATSKRLLSWVVTRGDIRFLERALPADDLQRMVAAYQATMERRAPVPTALEHAARLFDVLVRPIAPLLEAQQVLVVVPDALLQAVSFASLWDRQAQRYLAEDHLVATAPSGTVFVLASAAAAREEPLAAPHLLAVGNPRLDRNQSKDLPTLAGAEAEATEIARLYKGSELLIGRSATKAAFLAGALKSEVVHFAGHAMSGDGLGGSQLLLAPDPLANASGVLDTAELDRMDFQRTRVVVLAGCRTASGAVSRLEGTMSLARPFLAAGVPTVIASLWDVDDAVSRRFFVEFHRALLSEQDPALALRLTQRAFLRSADPALAHPASWAGFACIGGLNPRALVPLARTVTLKQPS